MQNLSCDTLPIRPLCHEIIDSIIQTESYLSTLEDKSPQPILNQLLHKLVAMVTPTYKEDMVDEILQHKTLCGKLSSLRDQLSHCEYALETSWGGKIANSDGDYTRYPYIENYYALVGAELNMLHKHMALTNQSICFIGSGPMPITAFEFKRLFPQARVTCVEKMASAVAIADKISRLSGMTVSHHQNNAENIDYSEHDFILIASMTIGKKNVLEKIVETSKSGTIIGIRSVEGLRHVLYEAVNLQDIPANLVYLGKTEYQPEHVNTTLFYQLNK